MESVDLPYSKNLAPAERGANTTRHAGSSTSFSRYAATMVLLLAMCATAARAAGLDGAADVVDTAADRLPTTYFNPLNFLYNAQAKAQWLNGEPAYGELDHQPTFVQVLDDNCSLTGDSLKLLKRTYEEYRNRGVRALVIFKGDTAKLRDGQTSLDQLKALGVPVAVFPKNTPLPQEFGRNFPLAFVKDGHNRISWSGPPVATLSGNARERLEKFVKKEETERQVLEHARNARAFATAHPENARAEQDAQAAEKEAARVYVSAENLASTDRAASLEKVRRATEQDAAQVRQLEGRLREVERQGKFDDRDLKDVEALPELARLKSELLQTSHCQGPDAGALTAGFAQGFEGRRFMYQHISAYSDPGGDVVPPEGSEKMPAGTPTNPKRRACTEFSPPTRDYLCCAEGFRKGMKQLAKHLDPYLNPKDPPPPALAWETHCTADYRDGMRDAGVVCTLPPGGCGVRPVAHPYRYLGCYHLGVLFGGKANCPKDPAEQNAPFVQGLDADRPQIFGNLENTRPTSADSPATRSGANGAARAVSAGGRDAEATP